MKCIRTLLMSIMLAAFLTVPVCAYKEEDALSEQKDAYGLSELEQSLPQEAIDIFADDASGTVSEPGAYLDRILYAAGLNFGVILRDSLRNVCQILLIGIVTSLLCSLPCAAEQAAWTSTAGAMTAAVLGASHASACFPQAVQVVKTLSSFSGKILPALSAAAAAGGAITSAGARFAVSSLLLDLYCQFAIRFLVSFLSAFMGLVLAANVLQNDLLQSIAALFKRMVTILLIGSAVILSSLLLLTGMLHGAADTAALKAAKAALSGALPVVGKILSDAAEAVTSGAAVLCSGAGVLGIAVVTAVCIVPYLTLGVHYLLFKCMCAFCVPMSDKRFAGLLSGLADVYAILLGTVGTISFAVYASILSFIRAVQT